MPAKAVLTVDVFMGPTPHYGWAVRERFSGRPIQTGFGALSEQPTSAIGVEWRALVEGLRWLAAQPKRPFSLTIQGESGLLVNQLTGRSRCRDKHLLALRDEALSLLGGMLVPWSAQRARERRR